MTQELRGLGNNSTRARNALNISMKPKPAMGSFHMGSGTSGGSGPVKIQNFIADSKASALVNDPEVNAAAVINPKQQDQPSSRSFSPVVFMKRYLNIAI